MNKENKINIIGLKNVPLVKEGDNISEIIIDCLNSKDISLEDGDIIVIAQTIISKSNGRIININDVKPSERAIEIFEKINPKVKEQGLPIKDPKLIQLILDESKEIIKMEHVLITETNNGLVCANAGIDKSNIEGKEYYALLPENPDEDADQIRTKLKKLTNREVAVIISDSFGRAFRVGAVGVALGVSRITPILDKRGERDLFGHELQTTIVGQADSLASAAQLIMGEADEGIPIVLIRGYKFEPNENANIKSILRNRKIDLFRGRDLEEILKERRSYKLEFDSKEIDQKIIERCIEISRWAPSAHNGQFWRYIIIEKGKTREELINKMSEKLRKDLLKDGKSNDFINNKINKIKKTFLKAPILILLCLDTTDLEKYTDEERSHNELVLGIQSISSSASYLLIAFQMKELAACWYCAPLFAKEICKKILHLPESFNPMAFFTVGYPKNAVKAPIRKKLEDILILR